jgi:hypothetical protein
MIPRVQTAIDVQSAIKSASRRLTEIGFDASVLEDGYTDIQATINDFADREMSPDPDDNTRVVPGGGTIDKRQMVRYC